MTKHRAFPVLIALVVAGIVAVAVGGVVLAEVSNVPEERDAMRDRANTVYDDTAMTYHTQGDLVMDLPGPTDPDVYTTTELVEKHLYVTGYSYPPDRLARVLDRGTGDVRESLRELEREGVVKSGWTTDHYLPTRMWVHAGHGDLADQWWQTTPMTALGVGVLVVGAVTGGLLISNLRDRGDLDDA